MEQKTLGEARIRTDFNVSNSNEVDEFKVKTAELINLIEKLKANRTNNGAAVVNGEFIRLCALAQTAYEEAAMWIVKAVTF